MIRKSKIITERERGEKIRGETMCGGERARKRVYKCVIQRSDKRKTVRLCGGDGERERERASENEIM